jgi:hypothetical protein
VARSEYQRLELLDWFMPIRSQTPEHKQKISAAGKAFWQAVTEVFRKTADEMKS